MGTARGAASIPPLPLPLALTLPLTLPRCAPSSYPSISPLSPLYLPSISPEVRAIIIPRVKNLLDIVELFLTRIVSVRDRGEIEGRYRGDTRIVSVRGLLPYGPLPLTLSLSLSLTLSLTKVRGLLPYGGVG